MQYTQEIIDFLEISYGKYMLSPGGDITKDIFKGINLDNKKVLDIGSGLGGVALKLAKKNKCEVIGVDVEDLVIKIAQENLNKENIRGKVKFKKCLNLKELDEINFDIAFSKESILHVRNKNKLFKDIYNKLKNDGELIIVDWFHREEKYSKEMEKFLKFDGLQMYLTKTDHYLKILKEIGFKDIEYKDYTKLICKETKEVLEKTKTKLAPTLKKRFGKEYYESYCISGWEQQSYLMDKKEIIVGKIKAKK